MNFEFECYSVCLIYLGSKQQICSYSHIDPSKTIPHSIPKQAKFIPAFNGSKIIPFGLAHTPLLLISYIRKYNLQAVFIPSIQTAPLKFHECSYSILVIKLEKINSSLKLSLRFQYCSFDCIVQYSSAINAHPYQMPASSPASNFKYNIVEMGVTNFKQHGIFLVCKSHNKFFFSQRFKSLNDKINHLSISLSRIKRLVQEGIK